jgi:hypothetical protein
MSVLLDRDCSRKAPVDRARISHERVCGIDDLVEPCPEEIRVAGLALLFQWDASPLLIPTGAGHHGLKRATQFAGKRVSTSHQSQ